MPASPQKLDLASLDVAADKQRLLRRLFPEVFTETTYPSGGDGLSIDFDKLKAVLGEHGSLAVAGQERYGLEWPGKRDVRLDDYLKNPAVFAGWATKAINKALAAIVEDGVTYQRIEGLAYEQHLFDEDDAAEITAYASRLYQVQNKDKALHDFVEWDSEVERSFAEALDAREEVKLFFKLPRWFQIPTPVGPYNPDWAIVAGNPDKVYLIRETKSTGDVTKRRESENQKIKFGKLHFKALSQNPANVVNFKDCVTLQEALASLSGH